MADRNGSTSPRSSKSGPRTSHQGSGRHPSSRIVGSGSTSWSDGEDSGDDDDWSDEESSEDEVDTAPEATLELPPMHAIQLALARAASAAVVARMPDGPRNIIRAEDPRTGRPLTAEQARICKAKRDIKRAAGRLERAAERLGVSGYTVMYLVEGGITEATGVGTCATMAGLVLKYLVPSLVDAGMDKAYLDVVDFRDEDHEFVVLNQPAGPDGAYPFSFLDWQPDAIIIDPWAGFVGSAHDYPGAWMANAASWSEAGLQIGTNRYVPERVVDGKRVAATSENYLQPPESRFDDHPSGFRKTSRLRVAGDEMNLKGVVAFLQKANAEETFDAWMGGQLAPPTPSST